MFLMHLTTASWHVECFLHFGGATRFIKFLEFRVHNPSVEAESI